MIVLITGANRGLGLATAEELAQRGHEVIATARNVDALRTALQPMLDKGLAIRAEEADVTRPDQLEQLALNFGQRHEHLDVLINNAGAILDQNPGPYGGAGTLESDPENLLASFNINTLGPLRMVQAFLPFLKKSEAGRIVNVSSGMGGLAEMGGYWPGYRMSKAALNALTRILHSELQGTKIKINAVCPGWVRTDMGGPQAPRSIEEGIRGIVWAATLPEDGPSGGFFRDGHPVAW
ncbi:MAG: SDR family oxidoreductase [Acidobacteria bacterium]|nr:SDR family oxidoreductase [Acidobacteriota bacterium]MCB9397452.1 SDR family oxidoreductase [Acidobacteriota bacterium]